MQRVRFSFLYAVICVVLFGGTQAHADFILAKDGHTDYGILVSNDAIPAETTAASELKQYLEQITGAKFPIVREGDAGNSQRLIIVGQGKAASKLLPDVKWNDLGSDGIVIRTVGKTLVLAGQRPRGALYAVYQFLEDVGGCRWWSYSENTIPKVSTFSVPDLKVLYTPPFAYREILATKLDQPDTNNAEFSRFATILRMNGNWQKQPEQWGDHYSILGFAHTFTQLLPPEKYFKAHPEWYSDPKNGGRPCTSASPVPLASDTQLCLSSPGVLEELTQQALLWIEANPKAGYISISETDIAPYCTCEACLKVLEREGSQSGMIVDFVNKVAARIKQEYPDFIVETLAYHGSVRPPKTVRPADNVTIQIAPIMADFGHPLDSKWNAGTKENIENWAKIAPQLFIWNYVTNFKNTLFPHPNWLGLASDLRFFEKNHVTGVFEQGNIYTNGVGDFANLRTWMLAKLMWNPKLDEAKLRDEFLQGYYGAAAPDLRKYLDLVETSFLDQNRVLSTYNSDFSYLTLDVMNEAEKLFASACAAVEDDPVLKRRVQTARFSVDLAWLDRYQTFKRIAAQEKKPFFGPEDPQKALQSLTEASRELDLKNASENTAFADVLAGLSRKLNIKYIVPDFLKDKAEEDVRIINSAQFSLFSIGRETFSEEDGGSSTGAAVSMLGKAHNDWLVQVPLSEALELSDSGRWHAYALMRMEKNEGVPPGSDALYVGIYNQANKEAHGKGIPQSELSDTYKAVDLGVFDLTSSQLMFFTGRANPAVKKVYFDELVLVRDQGH